MTRRIRIQELERFLETLGSQGTADFHGTLVLGEVVGNVRDGGYFDPTHRINGQLNVIKKSGAYEFSAEDSTQQKFFTENQWYLCKGPGLHYATRLRRSLRRVPHLIVTSDNLNQKYHFAILYDSYHQ